MDAPRGHTVWGYRLPRFSAGMMRATYTGNHQQAFEDADPHPSRASIEWGGTTMATITITAADAATDTAALHATTTAPAATPADVAAAKRFVSDFVDRSLPEYQKISLAIHDKPEVSNYEFFASTTLADQLKSEGFDVTVGVASHRTGFEAAYDTGRPGPTVVFLAEYDALPGIGHGCGHSVYGPNSSLAGAALKQVIDRFGGQVRVDGTPGEEGSENGSAKGASTRASSTMWTSPCARTRPTAAITCHRATWPANRSISSSRARRHTPRAAPNSASTRSTA